MTRIEHPQGLHGRIECAAGCSPDLLRGFQELHQIGGRRGKGAQPVQFNQHGVFPVEAENALQARDFRHGPFDEPFGG